ncbi:MAG: DNA-directed RNA polymerase subunit alpha [Chlamydiae bacterium]|nr:DNA-directed RNA polymerase subunit alpha [Chlamydiota bacterium]
MSVMYGKFEMPEKIKYEEVEKPNVARFTAEPFERGFGHTLGNFLRRIMLTSLEAPAIVSVKIEGVLHEFAAIDGVIEDMTHIVLNLKGSLLRYLPIDAENAKKEIKLVTKILEVTDEQIDKGNGSYKVTLRDIVGPSQFEIVNPDMVIFTATKPFTKRIDLRIGIGRGYVPSERHVVEKVIDEIIIDSAFSPVRLVNYYVEKTRVGQDTDFDKLIIDVITDGRVTPKEAFSFALQLGMEHLKVFENLKTHDWTFESAQVEENKDREDLFAKLALKISEIELSVRSTNCLAGAHIDTIGELVVMPESEMLKFRNFGKKSLTEIKQKLLEMNLSLGMDLSKYGITRENVKALIQKYLDEKNVGSEK